jgi:hypothetical protein
VVVTVSPAEECALNNIEFIYAFFLVKRAFLHYSFDTVIQIIGGETIMPSEKVLEAKKAKVEQLTEVLKNAVREAGSNVIEDVLFVKGGLPFLGGVKDEEKQAVKAWMDKISATLA